MASKPPSINHWDLAESLSTDCHQLPQKNINICVIRKDAEVAEGAGRNKERGGLQSKQAQLGNKSTHFHQSFPCVFLCAEV